jgi:hypothetical protein
MPKIGRRRLRDEQWLKEMEVEFPHEWLKIAAPTVSGDSP